MLPRAKKSFGQNFLVDPSVVQKIIEAASIQKGETVLEIGPGTGLLTEALVHAGARVIAVELDHDLITPLQEKFGDKIQLIEGDVLKLDLFPVQDSQFKLIANIPYNITSPIIEKFLAKGPYPTMMILMVQKEVADRILAKPPETSLLSIVCQVYATCSRIAVVKAGAFRPIPKVDSALVKFVLKSSLFGKEGPGLVRDPERVIALAKAGFIAPRKQLHHNLLPYLRRLKFATTAEDIKNIFRSIHLDPRVRAENLTLSDWIKLDKVIHE